MKKLFLIALSLLYAGGISLAASAEQNSGPGKLTVYYFHGSFRCPTCKRMERYSRKAVESRYPEALKSGRIEYKTVNVDEPDNERYAKHYNLYTKSLVLSWTQNGQETRYKNLEKIWEYAGQEKKFIAYVTGEIDSFIKGVP